MYVEYRDVTPTMRDGITKSTGNPVSWVSSSLNHLTPYTSDQLQPVLKVDCITKGESGDLFVAPYKL